MIEPQTTEEEELLTTPGQLLTHWACPYCGEENESEDDAKGEFLECISCDQEVLVA